MTPHHRKPWHYTTDALDLLRSPLWKAMEAFRIPLGTRLPATLAIPTALPPIPSPWPTPASLDAPCTASPSAHATTPTTGTTGPKPANTPATSETPSATPPPPFSNRPNADHISDKRWLQEDDDYFSPGDDSDTEEVLRHNHGQDFPEDDPCGHCPGDYLPTEKASRHKPWDECKKNNHCWNNDCYHDDCCYDHLGEVSGHCHGKDFAEDGLCGHCPGESFREEKEGCWGRWEHCWEEDDLRDWDRCSEQNETSRWRRPGCRCCDECGAGSSAGRSPRRRGTRRRRRLLRLALLVKLLSLLVKQKRRKGRRRARRACSSARLARKRHRAQLRWLRRFYAFLRSVKRRSSAADSSDDSEEWGPSSSVSQRQASNKPETGSAPAEPAAEELAERVSLPADVPELEELPYAIDDLSNSGWNHFCKFEDMTFLGQNDDVVSSPAGVSRWGWADSPRRVSGVVQQAVRPAEKVGGGYGNGGMTGGGHQEDAVEARRVGDGKASDGYHPKDQAVERGWGNGVVARGIDQQVSAMADMPDRLMGGNASSSRQLTVTEGGHLTWKTIDNGTTAGSSPERHVTGDVDSGQTAMTHSSHWKWVGLSPPVGEERLVDKDEEVERRGLLPLPSDRKICLLLLPSSALLRDFTLWEWANVPVLVLPRDFRVVRSGCFLGQTADPSIILKFDGQILKLEILKCSNNPGYSGSKRICPTKGGVESFLLSEAKIRIDALVSGEHRVRFYARDPPPRRWIGSPTWLRMRRLGCSRALGNEIEAEGATLVFPEKWSQRSAARGPLQSAPTAGLAALFGTIGEPGVRQTRGLPGAAVGMLE